MDPAAALARLGGKLHVYERMLHSFHDDLAAMAGQLQGCVAAGDTPAAARLLHTLRGLAATLGASALSAAAAQAERRLAGGDAAAADLARAVGEALAAIDAATPGLTGLMQALSESRAEAPPAVHRGGSDTVRTALVELAALLDNSDMRATELMTDVRRQHGAALGPAGQALDDAVQALDFTGALARCRTLVEGTTR
jgi:HPt (histidine-containing phosphotransfer) domain-containing protein